MAHDRRRAVGTNARWQQIGPELRTEQVAHVLVVRIEHDPVAHPHLIAGTGEEAAACPGVGADGGDGQLRRAAQDGLGQIVDGVDVGPGFIWRTVGRFDHIQMNAVRPEIVAAGQYDDAHRLRRRPAESLGQPPALRRAHRTIIEIEGQETDTVRRFPGDVLPGRMRHPAPAGQRLFRQPAGFREGQRRRQLDAARAFDVADPHRTIDGCPADGGFAPGQQLARYTAQCVFRVRIKQVAGRAEQFVGNPGKAISRMQTSKDFCGRLRFPVDFPVSLTHQRVRHTGHALRHEIAGGETLDCLQHGAHCRFRDFFAIQRSLGGRAHGKCRAGPHRPGVHFGLGLQHRDAPGFFAAPDRPVQRRRTAITGHAGMDDETRQRRPHRRRNRPLQERCQQQVGPETFDRLLGERIGDVEFDAELVSKRRQFAKKALRQTIETVRYE